jgi:hypothetical protein
LEATTEQRKETSGAFLPDGVQDHRITPGDVILTDRFSSSVVAGGWFMQTDRNLLFGVLAFQDEYIDLAQLAAILSSVGR